MTSVPAATAIVQIGWPGKKACMIDPITVATSTCGMTMEMLSRPTVMPGFFRGSAFAS